MKAIRLHARGGPEQVVYEDAPMPTLQPGDALVRVLASGTTRDELVWDPTYTDEKGNSRTPTIPGHELCGIVEKLAPDIANAGKGDIPVVGDAVYGLTSFFRDGTAAEYIAVKAADLAPKPKSINAVEAASIPLSALTAWQALFDRAQLRKGQRILIHGGAGGVGIFAVQMARWCGAHVIATAQTHNIDFVRSLGADELIDYKTSRFEDKVKNLDVIFDPIGGDTQRNSWPLLKRGGVLVSIAGESIEQPDPTLGVRGVFFIVKADRQQLIKIGQLLDNGVVKTIVSTILPLQEAGKAFEMAFSSGKRGKIVLSVGNS
ncbi:NADP-dependent oxidoreductase [Puia sp.]|jgi:NADPH:quinone reductase-like Zn-dependent oxidoreductase|uniref:NADP-dependent oxidoreductase n=1 Tax=Puia sp. TaxID=2045100 RepID=UPI002F3EF8BB